MVEPKTKPTTQDPRDFLNGIEPEQKRKDALVLLDMFEKVTGQKPVMWGPTIIGFGQYHYKSDRSRCEGDWPLTGFSPRKANLTLYVICGDPSPHLDKLGKHKTSVSCLYINKLADVDTNLLPDIIRHAWDYGCKNFQVTSGA